MQVGMVLEGGFRHFVGDWVGFAWRCELEGGFG